MRQSDVPPTTPRSWAAIAAASVFGTNLGDLVSHTLGLGHLRGLPFLALAFALVLGAERNSFRGGEACYWLAIVLLRTAATNLADLATHDAGLDPAVVIPGLAALLGAVLLLRGRVVPNARPDALGRPVPVTDLGYWAAMLTAGTLGTVAGDLVEDVAGQGAAVVACAPVLLAAVLAHGALRRPGLAAYWATIVMARTAGTAVGDFAADRAGSAWACRWPARAAAPSRCACCCCGGSRHSNAHGCPPGPARSDDIRARAGLGRSIAFS